MHCRPASKLYEIVQSRDLSDVARATWAPALLLVYENTFCSKSKGRFTGQRVLSAHDSV